MDVDYRLLVFTLSGLRCGLPLSRIERVVRMVEINPLPRAPEIVLGLINVRGVPIPVLNIRSVFGVPEAGITLNDHIIVARTKKRPIAILVDYAIGVAEYGADDVTESEDIFPGLGYLNGVVRLKDGIVYIYDPDRFLSLEEAAVMDGLLGSGISPAGDEGHEA